MTRLPRSDSLMIDVPVAAVRNPALRKNPGLREVTSRQCMASPQKVAAVVLMASVWLVPCHP